jgi:hypothetical protein
MRLLTIGALAATLLTASAASAVPFGPTSASVAAGDPINSFYQKHVTITTCTTAGHCTLVFPTVTDMRVVITHVSCEFSLPIGSNVVGAKLTSTTGGSFNDLQVFSGDPISGFVVHAINAETYEFYDKGFQPAVAVEADAPLDTLACTLTGYHS